MPDHSRIQGFIFSWYGHEQRAAALEERLRAVVPATVINSEASARVSHPAWVHLDESAYFSEQWNRARELFDADILFHVQADADPPDVAALVERAASLFMRYDIGVYEPNVDYTDIWYDKARLPVLEDEARVVPWTDCTCWFVSAEVLRRIPPIDLSINRLGWGVSRAVGAFAHLAGLPCVRDYRFTVQHPKHRGYSAAAARLELNAYLESLPAAVQAEVQRLTRLRAAAALPAGDTRAAYAG